MKINFVLPIYNEEIILADNIKTLYYFLKQHFIKHEWLIILSDNNSTDKTPEICKTLCNQYAPNVQYLRLEQKGKGFAIRSAFTNFNADFYFFIDADLSVGLNAIVTAFNLLLANCDIVVGLRINHQHKVQRNSLRKFVGFVYRSLIIILFRIKICDPACGFKAMNHKIVKNVLPLVCDNQFFFDTELVIIANNNKHTIREINIEWIDNRNPKRPRQIAIITESIRYLYAILKLLLTKFKQAYKALYDSKYRNT